jgi:hypothetical protein
VSGQVTAESIGGAVLLCMEVLPKTKVPCAVIPIQTMTPDALGSMMVIVMDGAFFTNQFCPWLMSLDKKAALVKVDQPKDPNG